MLIKASKLIGKKVMSLDGGKEISEVKDLVYDPKANQVKAFLLDDGGWFSDAKVIAFEEISSIGQDAVMVQDEMKIKMASEVNQRVSNIAKDDQYLTKSKVMTQSGQDLGVVTDIFFDTETGRVEELEVSEGQLQNLQSGKKTIKVSEILTIGEDATIVRNEAVGELEEQEKQGGAQGIFEHGKQAIEEGLGKVRENVDGDTKHDAQNKLHDLRREAQEEFENIKSQAQSTLKGVKHEYSERHRQDAIGQFLTVNVLDQNDNLLAQRGQVVTHDLLQQAQIAGMESKVLSNVSKEPPTEQL